MFIIISAKLDNVYYIRHYYIITGEKKKDTQLRMSYIYYFNLLTTAALDVFSFTNMTGILFAVA